MDLKPMFLKSFGGGDIKNMLLMESEIGNKFNVLDKTKGLNLTLPKSAQYNHISEETKQVLKTARLGKSAYWNNTPVDVFGIDGMLIKKFDSIKDCAAHLNCSTRLIKNGVSGNTAVVLGKYQIRKSTDIDYIGIPKERKVRSDKNSKRIKYGNKEIVRQL